MQNQGKTFKSLKDRLILHSFSQNISHKEIFQSQQLLVHTSFAPPSKHTLEMTKSFHFPEKHVCNGDFALDREGREREGGLPTQHHEMNPDN